MVPSTYDAYFATVATAAAALIGLLFVAVSLRDETIFGAKAKPGGEALAVSAFIGLAAKNTVVFVITLAAYAAQLFFAVLLLIKPDDRSGVENLAYILFGTLIVSLSRAWSLMRGKHLVLPSADDAGPGT